MYNVMFLHGFETNPETSTKTKTLYEHFGENVYIPDLSKMYHDGTSPYEILRVINDGFVTIAKRLLAEGNTNPWLVIGTSLGGLYATKLAMDQETQLLLVNPSLEPYVTLADKLEPNVVNDYYTLCKNLWVNKADRPKLTTIFLAKNDECVNPEVCVSQFVGSATFVICHDSTHRFERFAELLKKHVPTDKESIL